MTTIRPFSTPAVCALIALAALTTACDDDPDTAPDPTVEWQADLQRIAAAEVASDGLLGLGITVVLPDGRLIEAGAGYSAPGPDAAPYSTVDTVQVMGSVTKVLTAARALQLAERGVLGLDETLDRWFAFDGAASITVRMLLDHTSGLNDCLALMPPERMGEDWAPAALVELATAAEPYAAPGGAVGWYSNTNAVLLASIIEQVTGRGWGEGISAELAAPLGLTTVGYAGAADRQGAFADGWFTHEGAWASSLEVIDPSIGWGAGALVMSNHELARFARALFDGALFTDPATLASMQAFDVPLADALRTPGEPPQRLGLGLIRYQVGEMALDGHFGHVLGYQAALFHDPETDAVIVVSANTEGVQVGFTAVEVAGVVRGWVE